MTAIMTHFKLLALMLFLLTAHGIGCTPVQARTAVNKIDRDEILEGVIKISGESGNFDQGWASFGGATDGSVCDSSPCTRYRAVGIGENMSATRVSTGDYNLSVSGFKSNSKINCECSSAPANAVGHYACGLNNLGFDTDANGDAFILVRTSSATSSTDHYFTVSCKGEVP